MTRRNALITGSSRGIGLAIAKDLAQAGYNVCLNCTSVQAEEALHATARALAEKHDVITHIVRANVADTTEAARLVDEAQEALGGIDVLVNNAGITRDALTLRMSESDFDRVIDVNLKGTFNCCKAVLRPMSKKRWGRIINMSSVVGIFGNAGQANYAASKAGVIGLTKSLSREMARRGITVNAIAPGFIETDMTAALTEDQRAAILGRIGAGRLGAPSDVSSLVRFLASDEAAYITGQVICVDGGLTL